MLLKRVGLLFAAIGVSLSMASASHGQPARLIDVKLAVLPIAPQAPVYLAQQLGFFAEEGLRVEARVFQGGPEVTAAVISGDVDFGYANTVSPMIAYAQGAPVRLVAPSDIAGGPIVDAVLAKSDGSLANAKDLMGKRVAVNALKGILELLVRAAVDQNGGDSSKVIFLEAPFPQMGALLAAGQVDAVVNVEPFITQMVGGGAKIIIDPLTVIAGGPIGIWFSSVQKANNKDLLDRFRRAIAKANVYATEHPDEVRKIVPTFTRISPDTVAKMALPVWTGALEIAPLQRQADLLAKYNFIRKPLKASDLVVK